MTGAEPDRVAMLSDLKALEERLEERLEKRIVARVEQIVANNHEDTRRYFTIMVERVESAVALVAEVNSPMTSPSMPGTSQ